MYSKSKIWWYMNTTNILRDMDCTTNLFCSWRLLILHCNKTLRYEFVRYMNDNVSDECFHHVEGVQVQYPTGLRLCSHNDTIYEILNKYIIWNLHQNLGIFPALLGQHLLVVIRETWDRIRCFIYSNVFVSAQVIIYLQFIFPVWYCFIILHLSLFFTSTLDCSFLILNTRTYFSRSFKPLSKPLVADHRITI